MHSKVVFGHMRSVCLTVTLCRLHNVDPNIACSSGISWQSKLCFVLSKIHVLLLGLNFVLLNRMGSPTDDDSGLLLESNRPFEQC